MSDFIGLILSTLVEFGLLREDYKHRKKISKKEKQDGKKRTFEKHILQPSNLIMVLVVILIISVYSIFYWFQHYSLNQKNTHSEISEIKKELNEWNNHFGNYPISLKKIIGHNPNRQDWHTDSWGYPYIYTINKNDNSFTLRSFGLDQKTGIKDNIK